MIPLFHSFKPISNRTTPSFPHTLKINNLDQTTFFLHAEQPDVGQTVTPGGDRVARQVERVEAGALGEQRLEGRAAPRGEQRRALELGETRAE